MIKQEFDDEIEAVVIEIKSEIRASLSTEDGISTHKKFALLELPSKNDYPRIIFQNLSEKEKEQLFELLDNDLHDPDETNSKLIEKLSVAEYKLDELKSQIS